MPLTNCSTIFEPADLAIMQRVFDQLCRERHLALNDQDQREWLALQVVETFANGIVDETELWQTFSKLLMARREA
jgi:hypothetical protein